MSTFILKAEDVRGLLDMPSVIEAVEQGLRDLAAGKAKMPPKVYLFEEKGDFRAMPASIPGAAGIKWVNVHPGNPQVGLPTVMATIIYSDPLTGYPLAIMDGTDITAYRTGATATIAAKYLARKDAHTLGLIGAGRQAQTQLLAHVVLFDIRRIKIYDRLDTATADFIRLFPRYPVETATLEEAVACDIVCTTTPVRTPLLLKGMVKPGTHYNAIGADAPGKEEFDPAILKMARVVVDEMEQAIHSGEINVPVSQGLFTKGDIFATLPEVVSGQKPGRTDDKQITLFDSTGLAIEDIATAQMVYEKATRRQDLLSVQFI
jgi:alanine dehydrogenase